MTKFFLGTIGAIATVIAAALGVLAITGGASATEDPTSEPAPKAAAPGDRVPPDLLAVTIGQLEEDGEDDSATVDLRAADRDGDVLGTLRFFSEEYGYYNGGVREFTCDAGVITAKGGGGLVQPDGTRVAVKYTATINTETNEATIAVQGRDIDYTMEGTIDGLVWCGDPAEAPPTVADA